jgi:acetyltransferase-like isoleucine patch superfamily enzyme
MHNDKLFFIIQSCLKYNSFDWGIKLRSFLYKPFFRKFGKNIQIKDGVTIKYPSEIELGSNCKIGEYTYLVGKGGLKIGDNFLLGAGCKIITSAHNIENLEIPIFNQGLTFQPIEIGSNVWFGFDCKVFGNSRIADGVIIGADTLIKDAEIPQNAVVVGTPYRILKIRK